MKTTTALTAIVLMAVLAAPSAFATTYSYPDTWIDWPGYTSNIQTIDENGTPQVRGLEVEIDNNNYLRLITVLINDSRYSTDRQQYDSLFISTDGAWDSWNYLVRDGYTEKNRNSATVGNAPSDGLWKVDATYSYTFTSSTYRGIRQNSPNGIDETSLNIIDEDFEPTFDTSGSLFTLTYDFTASNILMNKDSFFVAYAPWCDNDVIGGGTAPVPEPATMLLFGTGLVGLASVSRQRRHRS